jgi:hypothetical protein
VVPDADDEYEGSVRSPRGTATGFLQFTESALTRESIALASPSSRLGRSPLGLTSMDVDRALGLARTRSV